MAQNGGTDILDDAPEVKAIEATEVAPEVANTVLVEDNTTTTEENKSDK
jgi:hypothetical protein